jgi:hypothetical protein
MDLEFMKLNDPPKSTLSYALFLLSYFFLNLCRPNPAKPINPMPNKSMVAGSATRCAATIMSSKSRSPSVGDPLSLNPIKTVPAEKTGLDVRYESGFESLVSWKNLKNGPAETNGSRGTSRGLPSEKYRLSVLR